MKETSQQQSDELHRVPQSGRAKQSDTLPEAEHAPDPADVLPALDENQLSVLQHVGSEWGQVCAEPEVWRQALPVHPDLTITVILPELVVRHWWHRLLHNQVAPRLRRALRPLPGIVVTSVPFHLPD
jgi:hypothetical protein